MRLRKLENSQIDVINYRDDTIIKKNKKKQNKKRTTYFIIFIILSLIVTIFIHLKSVLIVTGTLKIPIVELSTRTNSILLKLKCYEGKWVTPKDVLAIVQENENDIEITNKLLNGKNLALPEEAYLNEDRARVEIARKELARKQRLFELDIIVAQEVEKARASYQLALARYKQSLSEYESKKIQFLKSSNLISGTSTINNLYAPSSGFVGNILKQPGEVVRAGEPILTLLDTREPWIEVVVPEHEISNIMIGQSAIIETHLPRRERFAGYVESIGAQIDYLLEENVQGFLKKEKGTIVKITASKDKLRTLKPGVTMKVKFKKRLF